MMTNFNKEHYNLIVCYDETAWENNFATFPRDRFLENTYGNRFEKRDFQKHYDFLKELEEYPCLFLYEKQSVERNNLDSMGYIGYIENVSIDNKNIIFDLVKKDIISLHDIEIMSSALQIENNYYGELNRTHWAVKNTNLFDIIDRHRELLENKSLITKPIVLFSYSWDEAYTNDVVENLYDILIENDVNVVYDKKDLKAGHNMQYFMESVRRDDFTKIYAFCDKSYIDKANSSSVGVGLETSLLKSYVYNHPYQTKVIPISLDGSFSVPIFLEGVKGFSLEPTNWGNGVDQIINDIFES